MKIVVIEPIGISEEKLKRIETLCDAHDHKLVIYSNRVSDEAELIDRAEDAEILIVSNLPLSKNVLEACKKLKMISVAFTGVDHLPMDYCNEKGILVSNSAGYSNESVAELTFGMIFGLYRELVRMDTITRAGLDRKGKLGIELNGKTLGVIGTGAIGQRVMEIANVFNCKVIAYSRTPKQMDGVEFVSKEDLLKKVDIVSLHLPLTEETKNFIGSEEIALMKESAILINTARGPVVNTEALVEALNNKSIAGAAVDVYEKEPPLDTKHPLLDLPKTLLLPHIAYATHEAIDKRTDIVFENIWKWQAGNPQNVMK
jgi:D-3-phosphoglycerate dehydrogenase